MEKGSSRCPKRTRCTDSAPCSPPPAIPSLSPLPDGKLGQPGAKKGQV